MLLLYLGCTRGAKDTEMIFLVSHEFGPVRVILVNCTQTGRGKINMCIQSRFHWLALVWLA